MRTSRHTDRPRRPHRSLLPSVRGWAQALLVAFAFVLCAANDKCREPVPDDEVVTDERPTAEDPIPDGEPADETTDPTDEIVVGEELPGPDPIHDLIAVLPNAGDVLCVHPRHVDIALERMAAERVDERTWRAILEGRDGEPQEARFELFVTESPYVCSDDYRAEQDGPSDIVDLIALAPEDEDVLCVHPDYIEQVLERLRAQPMEDGRWMTYGSRELGELREPIVFGLRETLVPAGCGQLVGDGPAAPPVAFPDDGPVFVKGRFKVYTNAACNMELPASTSACVSPPMEMDDAARSSRVVIDARRACGKGTGFCVQVDSVIGRYERYLGSTCSGGLVSTEAWMGEACFVGAVGDGGGTIFDDPDESGDRFRVFKNAACGLYEAAFDSRCEASGSEHGSFAMREWHDWHKCRRGTGYCAEGKLVVGIEAWFDRRDGERCQTRLHEEPLIGFACVP